MPARHHQRPRRASAGSDRMCRAQRPPCAVILPSPDATVPDLDAPKLLTVLDHQAMLPQAARRTCRPDTRDSAMGGRPFPPWDPTGLCRRAGVRGLGLQPGKGPCRCLVSQRCAPRRVGRRLRGAGARGQRDLVGVAGLPKALAAEWTHRVAADVVAMAERAGRQA